MQGSDSGGGGVQMQVRWPRQLKNHTVYGKISRIAPRNVGVEVESKLKSVSESCNGS